MTCKYCLCKLLAITLPTGLTSFAFNVLDVFDHSINTIISKINDPFEWDGSGNFFDDCSLIVPQGKRDAYIAAGWTEEIFKRGIMEVSYDEIVNFADSKVKNICVAHWDLNEDGELDKYEAATVTDLGEFFQRTNIETFNELQHFVGLKCIGYDEYYYRYGTFEDCDNLTSVVIPKSLTTIGRSAFEGCDNLTSVVIPEGVTRIGEMAFNNCYNLTSIILPESLNTIENNAFYGCRISSFTLPASLTRIEYSALGCEVKSIISKINDPFEWDGSGNFFDDCRLIVPQGKRDAYISAGWTEEVFRGGITEVLYDGTISFADNKVKNICVAHWDSNKDGELDTYEAASVTELGEYFQRTSIETFNELQHFVGLKSVGYRNFEDCDKLTSIVIPEGVSNIGEMAFEDCRSLESVVLPESLTNIGHEAFYSCDKLTSIVLPENLTTIEDCAFSGCRITSITLPVNLKNIGYGALGYDLTSIISEINEPFEWYNNNSYGYGYVYYGCKLIVPQGTRDAYLAAGWTEEVFTGGILEKPDCPIIFADEDVKRSCVENWDTNGDGELDYNEAAAVTNLDYMYFYSYNGSFNELEYFVGLERLNFDYLFRELKEITVPKNVHTIEGYNHGEIFDNLTMIRVSKDNPYFDARYNCNAIIRKGDWYYDLDVLIAGGKNSFIPWDVAYIGGDAFSYSSLTSITIPKNIQGIGDRAFANCRKLTTVKAEMEVPFALDQWAFSSISESCILIVPRGTRDAYIEAGWTENIFKGGVFEEGTITARSYTIQYGDEIPTLGYDVVGDAATGEPAISTSATSQSPVGTYPITISQGNVTTNNYNYLNGTLTITKAPLTITGKSYTMVRGEALPTFEVEYSGFKNGQTNMVLNRQPTITCSATSMSAPGTYDIIVSGATAANYEISYVKGTLTIVNPTKVDLADGEIYTNDLDMNLQQLTYSRTYKNTEWQPWYVPFNLELTADVLAQFSFGKFAGTYTEEDGTFYISITRMHAGDVVKANTPYFVKAKTADEETPQVITLPGATLYAASENGFSMYSAEKKVTVQGIYNRKVVTEDDRGWYAFSCGKYSLQDKLGNVLKPFRFFLTITDREDNPYASTPNPTEVKIKVLGDDETGMTPIPSQGEEERSVYDLSGRSVAKEKATKGIYIINGKKTLVR